MRAARRRFIGRAWPPNHPGEGEVIDVRRPPFSFIGPPSPEVRQGAWRHDDVYDEGRFKGPAHDQNVFITQPPAAALVTPTLPLCSPETLEHHEDGQPRGDYSDSQPEPEEVD